MRRDDLSDFTFAGGYRRRALRFARTWPWFSAPNASVWTIW
jgi:hypothetical protein